MDQKRPGTQLQIGSLIFPQIDQIDFTGPFEVFSRIPNATCLTIAKERGPLRDGRGLILTPQKTFSEVGQLDLLHVPGGPGQEALMDDEETLSFIRQQSINAKYEAEAKAAGLGAAERLGLRREKAESIVAGLKEGIESARASTPASSATRPFFSRSLHRSISTTFSKPRKKCGGSIRSLFKFIASSSASLQTKNRESSGHISH